MANINLVHSNHRVYYILQHNQYGQVEIPADMIEGWNEDDKEYARNKDFDGMFIQLSNDLKFLDDAKRWINEVRKLYGVNSRIRVIRMIKDEEEKWIRAYNGLLDLSEWGQEDGKVTCKFNATDLMKTLKARQNDKIEVERLTDLKGNTIPPLEIKKLNQPGRRVFLDTKFNTLETINEAKCSVESNAGNTRADTCGFPLNLYAQSHDNAHSPIPLTNGTEDNGSTGMMFFAVNDRDRVLDIDLNFSCDAFFHQYENVQWCFLKICLTTYENGVNYDVKNRIVIDELDSGFPSNNPQDLPANQDWAYPDFTKQLAGSYSGQIELLAGESLCLEMYLKSDMYFDNNAGVRVNCQNIIADVNIKEDSYYKPTQCNGVLAYELFERLLRIGMSREDIFKSNLLGRVDRGYSQDGDTALTMFSHGHWVRRFDASNELYKPFTCSFKEAFESLDAFRCVGLGVESIGYGEKIRIEEKKYFWNPNVTVRLGEYDSDGNFNYIQVKNVKRATSKDLYFSSVNIGCQYGGVYDEIMGLEEVNGNSEYSTAIEAITNVYTKIAKFRADTIGEEIIRRRNSETHPTTDHSFDKHIFMRDVKYGAGDIFELKKWQDLLEEPPEGVYDPESAYNFIFSPLTMLMKHSWVLSAGCREYLYEKIRFLSSTAKTGSLSENNLVGYKYIGKPLRYESGEVVNSDLESARFVPEDVEFEYEVSDSLIKQIEGKTTLPDGTIIPNVYGLFEYKNEDGDLEKGFLMSLKPNGNGSFKMLKSNR